MTELNDAFKALHDAIANTYPLFQEATGSDNAHEALAAALMGEAYVTIKQAGYSTEDANRLFKTGVDLVIMDFATMMKQLQEKRTMMEQLQEKRK